MSHDSSKNHLHPLWKQLEDACIEILNSLRDQFSKENVNEIEMYIDHNEFGVAAELTVSIIQDQNLDVDQSTQQRINDLFNKMDLDSPLERTN